VMLEAKRMHPISDTLTLGGTVTEAANPGDCSARESETHMSDFGDIANMET